MDAKQLLITVMGLEENATDDQIANAAATFQADMIGFKQSLETENASLKNRAETAEGELAGVKEANETLSNSAKELLDELVNSDLETHKDVIADVAGVKEQLLSNRATTLGFLKGLKPAKEPLHNSSRAGQPKPVVSAETVGTKEEAARINNRARELQANLKLPFQRAWGMAKKEIALLA